MEDNPCISNPNPRLNQCIPQSATDLSTAVTIVTIPITKQHTTIRQYIKDYYTQKGYRVKSGFKYGSDYILYNESEKIHTHGFALVLIHNKHSSIPISDEIASFIRLTSIVHKQAYFAVVKENKICIYKIQNCVHKRMPKK